MSHCSNIWTLRFPLLDGRGGPPEYRPLTMDLQLDRGQLDYARFKFPSAVADQLKPQTRYTHGQLRDSTIAEALLDGTPVHAFYVSSDSFEYTAEHCYVDCYDLQYALDETTIDIQRDSMTLREVYTDLYEAADTDLITGVRFTDPDAVDYTYHGMASIGHDAVDQPWETTRIVNWLSADDEEYLEQSHAIDLEEISPLKAMWELNDRFRLQTWVDSERTLWVGHQAAWNAKTHVAAPDDSRVWRYTDATIRHPERPIKRVIYQGKMMHQAVSEDRGKWEDSYNPDNSDFIRRAVGIAERTDIHDGIEVIIGPTEANRDALPAAALNALREEMRAENAGQVRINPDLGGTYTAFERLKMGDFIHLVPEDEPFYTYDARTGHIDDPALRYVDDHCGSLVNNEYYIIDGIQHHVDDTGHWSVELDVSMYPEEAFEPPRGTTETYLMYFDPAEEEYYPEFESREAL